jgi:predicted neuraminidase
MDIQQPPYQFQAAYASQPAILAAGMQGRRGGETARQITGRSAMFSNRILPASRLLLPGGALSGMPAISAASREVTEKSGHSPRRQVKLTENLCERKGSIMKYITLIACLAAMSAGASDFAAEDIFPLQDKHVHGSSIVQLPDGSYIAAWFHGSGERTADDVLIQGARKAPGAAEWSPVFLMADTPGFPDCNPVLHCDAEGRLWLFWIAVRAHRWECSLLRLRRADAPAGGGAPAWTWQDVILLKPGEEFAASLKTGFDALHLDEGMWAEYALPYRRLLEEAATDPRKRQTGWMTRIHPLVLPSGRWLLPLYSDGFNVSLCAISDDSGATWRASGPMVGLGPIQPALVRKASGDIAAYLRDSGGAPGRVMRSISEDNGETWSPARDTDVPNPGSSLEVIALSEGSWLMVCNDTTLGRGRLTALLSEDEGETWPVKRVIDPGGNRSGNRFGYPSVIQDRNGRIHVTYSVHGKKGNTIRHAAFSAAWVREGNE